MLNLNLSNISTLSTKYYKTTYYISITHTYKTNRTSKLIPKLHLIKKELLTLTANILLSCQTFLSSFTPLSKPISETRYQSSARTEYSELSKLARFRGITQHNSGKQTESGKTRIHVSLILRSRIAKRIFLSTSTRKRFPRAVCNVA